MTERKKDRKKERKKERNEERKKEIARLAGILNIQAVS